jgi:hypothetical protein
MTIGLQALANHSYFHRQFQFANLRFAPKDSTRSAHAERQASLVRERQSQPRCLRIETRGNECLLSIKIDAAQLALIKKQPRQIHAAADFQGLLQHRRVIDGGDQRAMKHRRDDIRAPFLSRNSPNRRERRYSRPTSLRRSKSNSSEKTRSAGA